MTARRAGNDWKPQNDGAGSRGTTASEPLTNVWRANSDSTRPIETPRRPASSRAAASTSGSMSRVVGNGRQAPAPWFVTMVRRCDDRIGSSTMMDSLPQAHPMSPRVAYPSKLSGIRKKSRADRRWCRSGEIDAAEPEPAPRQHASPTGRSSRRWNPAQTQTRKRPRKGTS